MAEGPVGSLIVVVPLPPAGPRAAVLSLEILGRTVLDRTLDTLRALPDLDQLIVGELSLPLAGRGRGGGTDTILICDPDRPLLTLVMLMEFLEQTHGDRVAALVSPASDTYKVVRAGRVETTLDRASLCELQGLSRFDRQSFDRVFATGNPEDGLEAAQLAGIPIRLVQADPMNFAVRSPDDCRVAELVLGQ